MKLLEFKEEVVKRVTLVKALILFTFKKETAYWANNWASILSTTAYTFTVLVFINILYSNVDTLAGYNKNEMLVFLLVSQFMFYINWMISAQNLQELIIDINTGQLDMILTKPVPSLFYVSIKRIRLFSVLRDALPPTIAIFLSINWTQLYFNMINIFIGLVVFVCGMICLHAFQLIATIPVFWLGESKRIFRIAQSINDQGSALIPLEGFIPWLRILLSTIFPVLLSRSFTSSIILNKSEPWGLLIWSLTITGIAIYVMIVAWNFALRHYTSASS